jgi:hypothetical protein
MRVGETQVTEYRVASNLLAFTQRGLSPLLPYPRKCQPMGTRFRTSRRVVLAWRQEAAAPGSRGPSSSCNIVIRTSVGPCTGNRDRLDAAMVVTSCLLTCARSSRAATTFSPESFGVRWSDVRGGPRSAPLEGQLSGRTPYWSLSSGRAVAADRWPGSVRAVAPPCTPAQTSCTQQQPADAEPGRGRDERRTRLDCRRTDADQRQTGP